MPKWLGMTIHYATLKRVLTSRDGWIFSWGGPRKADKVFVLSPPKSCQCCKTHKAIEREKLRVDRHRYRLARVRELTQKMEAKAVVKDTVVEVVPTGAEDA